MNPFDQSGPVALATGSNGRLGFGMAEGLASAGAAVVIAGRGRAKSELAVAALRRTIGLSGEGGM